MRLDDIVLWVVGLDERKGVVGCNPTDFADWHAQINAEFDSIEPTVTDLRRGLYIGRHNQCCCSDQ